jgi:hypothetical protein
MSFFHIDLEKKFKKLFKKNLFNIFIVINYNYIKSLNEKNIKDIVIKINYDENIGIISYEIIPYATILSMNRDNECFISTINANNIEEVIYLTKNEFLFYPVKTYLRKYIIKKIIESDEDDF